jgi:aerobic-type carbon monoxide dehydrogenase small subunit (CoxS/CutS family)
VLLGHTQIRSCVTPVAGVVGQEVTTLEGLPALYAREHSHLTLKSGRKLHPLQQAWIDEQVPQCGYCQHGMIIQATDLLYKYPRPTDAQIRQEMNGHLCRCGTYAAIVRAIKRAALIIERSAR